MSTTCQALLHMLGIYSRGQNRTDVKISLKNANINKKQNIHNTQIV